MKIRTGFVSNSSSTSFTFFTKKPGLKYLLLQIQKHKDKFDLASEDVGRITASDVCEALAELKKQPKIIGKLIKNIEASIQYDQRWLERAKANPAEFVISHIADSISETKKELALVEQIQGQGFEYFLEVQFGDNHGDIQGDKVGTVMDYEGQGVSIDDESLKLRVENCH